MLDEWFILQHTRFLAAFKSADLEIPSNWPFPQTTVVSLSYSGFSPGHSTRSQLQTSLSI